MDRTRITALVAIVAGAAGCGTTSEVERLYIGGWIFLALIFVALLILLGLIVRYLAAGRRAAPPTRPVDTRPPPEDTGDPNDWV